jgi:protein SCO1
MQQPRLLTLIILVVLSLPLLGAFSGCRRPAPTGKRYELKGKVVSVDKDKRSVTVAHGDIKGYMPGMVMPFQLKEDWPLEVLGPGDLITATLVVDGASSWLEEVTITQESTDSTTKAADGSSEAKAGDQVPQFELVNQAGKRIKLGDYRGKALAVTFIYTRCPIPEYCTLMSNNFAEIDQQLQKQPDIYQGTHLLSVSIDPEYDQPAVLRSYGAAHTGKYSDEKFDHWEFASGNGDQIKGLAQFFGMRYYHDTQSGEEQIIHSLRTAVIGPDGKVFKVYRGNGWKPDEIVSDLKSLSEKK